jgi:hypothetical protein
MSLYKTRNTKLRMDAESFTGLFLINLFYRVSEKSGANGNFNYFSYFYLQVKVKG